MRRRRSRRASGAALAAVALAATAAPRTARGQVDEAGAAFLLLPLSARAVGVGNAHVADGVGTDAVVSNPAALAWLTRREGAIHYAQDFATKRVLASAAWHSRALGTFAVSASLTDLGEQSAQFSPDLPVGTLAIRNLFYAATYGSALGNRVSVGVTYKFVQNRYDCTGICSDPSDPALTQPPNASTSAVDLGVQYDLGPRIPVALGASVRHLGLRLQVHDEAQADQLPTQAGVGARVMVPAVARRIPDAELKLLGEFVTSVRGAGTREVRVGAEGWYRKAFVLRAGFVAAAGINESDGPSFGFGYVGRRVGVDFARQLTGLSAESDSPPTFVSLRYWF